MQFTVNIEGEAAKKFDPAKMEETIANAVKKGIEVATAQAEKDQGVKDGTITVNVEASKKTGLGAFKLPGADDDKPVTNTSKDGFKLPKGD